MEAGSASSSPSTGAPRARREYLTFWQGSPLVGTFADKRVRVDALARVARKTLLSGRVLWVIFGDGSLARLEPELVRAWHTRDAGLTSPGSQGRLMQLLGRLRSGLPAPGLRSEQPASLPGARLWQPRPGAREEQVLADSLDRILFGDDRGAPLFGLVLDLIEEGCPLPLAVEKQRGGPCSGGPQDGGATLVVLGGVRDMEERERAVLRRACEAARVEHRLLALGRCSELTSKVIAALEAADHCGVLASGLEQCRRKKWQPGPAAGLGQRPPPSADPDAQPLLLVVYLPTGVREAASSPELANLCVDVFLRSKGVIRNTRLTLMGSDGLALTIDFHRGLSEHDAEDFLRREADAARPGSLETVLQDWLRQAAQRGRGASRAEPLLLHVDESCPRALALTDLPAGLAAGGPADAPVAVVFASGVPVHLVTGPAARAGIRSAARASVGGPPLGGSEGAALGPALLLLLRGEGLLAAAVRATVPQPPPSRSAARGAAAAPQPKDEGALAGAGLALATIKAQDGAGTEQRASEANEVTTTDCGSEQEEAASNPEDFLEVPWRAVSVKHRLARASR